MLDTVGLIVPRHRNLWFDMLRSCNPRRIVEARLGDEAPQIPVEAWMVVLDKSTNPTVCSFWLQALRSPIVLITAQTGAAKPLARVIPMLAFICHPLLAEHNLYDLLFLSSRRTAGLRVIDLPRERRVESLRGVA